VRFYRFQADVEDVGNLFVGVALGDQLHHAPFSIAEDGVLARGSRQKTIEQGLRNLGGEERLVQRQ
jgi:hypothetical protein